MKEAFSMPLQGFDAIRILSQIISLQTLHYLVLSILIPPLLALFSHPSALAFEGGPTQVGMVLDWRELAGRPTWDWTGGLASWSPASTSDGSDRPLVWDPAGAVVPNAVVRASGGGGGEWQRVEGQEVHGATALQTWEWSRTYDPRRGWCIAAAWAFTSLFDILLLVTLVRRPTHILDHALTLHLVHLVLTSYYAAAPPTSLFWWCTMAVHAGTTVVWAEQLAVRRELTRSVGQNLVGAGTGAPRPSAKVRAGQRRTGESEQEAAVGRGGEEVEMERLA